MRPALPEHGLTAPARARGALTLERFGLGSPAEWLLFAPHRHEDYKRIVTDFRELEIGNAVVVSGRIHSKQLFDDCGALTTDPRRGVRLQVELRSVAGQSLSFSVFGKPGFSWARHSVDSCVHVRGVPGLLPGPRIVVLERAELVPRERLGRIVAVYPSLKTVPGERFCEAVQEARGLLASAADLVERNTGWRAQSGALSMSEISGYPDAAALLRELHWPESVEAGTHARRAARFLSAFALVHRTALRAQSVAADARSIVPIAPGALRTLAARLPYALSDDQKRAMAGIVESLRSARPMNGLLSGDVGSGKTVTYLLPLIAAREAGARVAIMTPNLLLISQIAQEIRTLFPEVPVCTITGRGIEGDPRGSIVIGSTALANAARKGKLGDVPHVLVIDEQQKFAVGQRDALRAPFTNVLEATATPIPRTAALAIHGSIDLFALHEIPVDKHIETRVFDRDGAAAARDAVIRAIRDRGEQAAVVYPFVEASTPDELRRSVTQAPESWSRFVPPESIAVLHGKLSDEEKVAILESFRSGRKRLLLASTVIEVGVTLPELKTMLVVGAERFGVVTLHQLRGRLARHGGAGEFCLFAEAPDEAARSRLALLVEHSDGFTLAEKDAEQRGYGDLLGIDGDAQSGQTRTLFQGVDVGPREIAFAATLIERLAHGYGAAMHAREARDHDAERGSNPRPL